MKDETPRHMYFKNLSLWNVSLCRTVISLHMRKPHSVVDSALTGWVSENRVLLVV